MMSFGKTMKSLVALCCLASASAFAAVDAEMEGMEVDQRDDGTFLVGSPTFFYDRILGAGGLHSESEDIKVSCMAFDSATFDEMMPGFSFERWRDNVCRLVGFDRGSVTLQVTVHKKLVAMVPEILAWAESIGIARIKWNLPVFISGGQELRTRYGVDAATVRELREFLSPHGRCEGSLFFDGVAQDGCTMFKDEIWILPDGSEEFCPNPERRFGDRNAAGATCGSCVLLKPFA